MADAVPHGMDTQPSMAKYAPVVAPVILVAVGYMDPGNWACAIEGGSRFGFELLWVVIASNIMAALFQTLATRLGLVAGKHLAQICREDYPRPVCFLLWILSEVSIVALDLTMVLGTAVGLNLLVGIPILPSVLALALDSVIFLVVLPIVGVQRAELVAGSIVGGVLVCFGLDTLLSRPPITAISSGIWPRVRGDSLYTAVGLLGANVVPHTFYLHSAVVQRHSIGGQSVEDICQKNMWDTIGAFGVALLANVAVLVVAATTFHNVGLVILTLQDAHALMEQILSHSIAPAVFGLALLCAGQLSTLTGTLTGKVTMEGFLDVKMQPWVHRSLVRGAAIIPAAFCAWRYGSEGLYQLLVFSQIIIALQLPFTAVPLIKASASEARMGAYRISSLVEVVAWILVAVVVIANIWLVFDLVLEEIDEFAGFAAHLENLLGTDSFGNYGGETFNTTVFALVLVGIALSVGFLVWLIVTPLRVDRIAMERKWVQEYELFARAERDEDALLGKQEMPGLGVVEYVPLPDNVVAVEAMEVELELASEDQSTLEMPLVSISSSSIEDASSKGSEVSLMPVAHDVIRAGPEVVKENEHTKTEDTEVAPQLFKMRDVLISDVDGDGSEEESVPAVPDLITFSNLSVPDALTNVVEDPVVSVKSLEVTEPVTPLSSMVEDNKSGAPESTSEDIVALLDSEFVQKLLSTTGVPKISAEASMPIRATWTATAELVQPADDAESIALKKAEAEADADLLEKEEDEGDGWEHDDSLALSAGGPGGSLSNLVYEAAGPPRSLGGRSDLMDGNAGGSGSGSMSQISGLGRAARKHFAACLDEFWRRLYDLHGQPVVVKGAPGSGRLAVTGAAAGSCIVLKSVDNGAFSGRPSSADFVDRDNGEYPANRAVFKATGSLPNQVDQMDVRAHSHAAASTSSGFPVYTHDYSDRSGGLSSYESERRYSSMRLPSCFEEYDRQPATIHGYQSPSFLSRSVTSSPAHKSSRPMDLDMHAVLTSRTLCGQALAQQPLGIGVERELESPLMYGRSLQGDRRSALESTIQSLRSSQRSMNAIAGRSSLYQTSNGDGDMHMSDAGPRSWDKLMERATLDPMVYRATGALHTSRSLGHSPIGRLGSTPGERAPLSFDQISPSQSRRDGFSLQSAQTENSLWSRQPFEQLFGGATDGGPARARAGSLGPGQNGNIGRSVKAVSTESVSNTPTSLASGADAELDIMENLRVCICKLLRLDGSEWLFRLDNGSDEDLVAAVAAVEKWHLEADTPDRLSRSEHWQVHGRPVSPRPNANTELRRVCYCGEACVWRRGLLISFGVWCVHRVLELSLMESRPDLWGKYTYVLNRLQGVLEPAFSKPRTVAPLCTCVLEAGLGENLSKRGMGMTRQGSVRDPLNGESQSHLGSAQTYPYPWPWGRNSSTSKGRGASATVFLEIIKDVEAAVGSRKGRTGTAAGDVAYPKGKENLASVLKRYKRWLGNKPPGSLVGGGRPGGGGRRSNGYTQAPVFAA